MDKRKLLLVVFLAGLIYGFFAFELQQYFDLHYFRSQQAAIEGYFEAHPWQTALIFFALYVAVTGLSLPGAALLTLIAGAIFGLLWGTLIVSLQNFCPRRKPGRC